MSKLDRLYEVLGILQIKLPNPLKLTPQAKTIAPSSSHPLAGLVAILCLTAIILSSGCNSGEENSLFDKGSKIEQDAQLLTDSNSVPRLSNSKEQLSFARSYFETNEHKRRAFEAVSKYFPEAFPETAIAALEIAYLQLGDDYRLANEEECSQALAHYDRILEQHGGFSEISAKALWYKGWVLSDLLNSPEQGIRYFREVVEKFPDTRIELHAPPPWISIFQESDEMQHKPFIPESSLSWAAMAHLEIIRHARSRQEAASSLSALSGSDEDHYLFVPSIKLFVHRFGLDTSIEQYIRTFLLSEGTTPSQRRDLQYLLTDNEG